MGKFGASTPLLIRCAQQFLNALGLNDKPKHQTTDP
jgi:hypothetical protein